MSPTFAPRERAGSFDARGLKLGILCARWNPTVSEALLASALEVLERNGARAEDAVLVRVPGAFELPAAARAVLDSEKPDALIAVGAIVRGETSHHEVLGHAVANALAALSAETGIPIGFGLLTCDTMEQARSRVSKGAEAAEAAIEMANLRRRLRKK
ncbi:MAG TPA: 6,7-dimethyl-8-ribityllumazine synthase [Thermoanaerobaculia bacterium]|nr:6,7-dimethyl-8-ribityllumazine synthase [Thermoanaerobaculia bacterium]